jgi:catechol 2,3-dioxygenase-like lactoylglutathione lyase family enzyme
MSVRGLAYVVLRCADLERSRRFYEVLGLPLVLEQHGSGSQHYSAEIGGVVLELYPFSGQPTSGLRLGLVVSDLAGLIESLKAMGMLVSRTDASATVLDPDGHQIALEQR